MAATVALHNNGAYPTTNNLQFAPVTLPAGILGGDVVFVFPMTNEDGSVAGDVIQNPANTTGWNTIDATPGNQESASRFWRAATETLGDPSALSGSTHEFGMTNVDAGGWVMNVVVVRGADPADPISASSVQTYTASGNATLPGLTPPDNDCLLLGTLAASGSDLIPNPITAAPSDMTLVTANGDGTGSGGARRMSVYSAQLSGTPTVADKTFAIGGGTPTSIGGMIAVKPAPPPTGEPQEYIRNAASTLHPITSFAMVDTGEPGPTGDVPFVTDSNHTSVATAGSSTTTQITPIPAGIEGKDLILVEAVTNEEDASEIICNTPGFVRIDNTDDTAHTVARFYKVADGNPGESSSDAASTVELALGDPLLAGGWVVPITIIRGADPTNPISAFSNQSYPASDLLTFKGLTPLHDNCLLIATIGAVESGATPFEIPAPAGMARAVAVGAGVNDGGARRGGMYSLPLSSQAPVSDMTVDLELDGVVDETGTQVSFPKHIGGMIAIKPAPVDTPEEPEEPAVGAVLNRRVGAQTADGFTVTAKVQNTPSAQLRVSTSPDLSNPTLSPIVTPVPDEYQGERVKATVTGLQPHTKYYYGWKLGGGNYAEGGGSCWTKPVDDTAASFSFGFASCSRSNSNLPIFTHIKEQDPLFFYMMGDHHYDDPFATSARPTTSWDRTLAQPRQQDLYANVSTDYSVSDHDFLGNNTTGLQLPAGAQEAHRTYRLLMPHHPLPVAGSFERTFQIGRVHFFMLDTKSFATAHNITDNSSKSKLGAAQKARFFAWLEAHRTEPKFIGTVELWKGSDGNGDGWSRFKTERAEIAQKMIDLGVTNVIFLSGDTHSLASHDGSYAAEVLNPAETKKEGAFPVFLASGLDIGSAIRGEPWQNGPYPTTSSVDISNYGWADVVDNGGDTISVTYRGRSDTGADLINPLTVQFTGVGEVAPPPPPPPPTGQYLDLVGMVG